MAKRLSHCPLCGGAVVAVVIKELPRWRRNGDCVLITDVPATRCAECGERFYASEVVLAMERIVKGKARPNRKVELPVYQLKVGAA